MRVFLLDVFYMFIIFFFLVSIDGLYICIRLIFSTVKVLDDIDLTVLLILVCVDRLYFGEGVSVFLKPWLSGKCGVGSGMVVSNLAVCMFRSGIVFGISFWFLCNSLCGWKELNLPGLGIMFAMVDGYG